MTITKAYGRVTGQGFNGAHARIEVLFFKHQGINIFNPKEIKHHFPPQGFVFAPNFFELLDPPINSLIEFTIGSKVSPKSSHHDHYLMDISKPPKRVGYPLIEVKDDILVHDQSIFQPRLKEYIQEELTHFYILHKGFIYGAFKTSNQDVVPKQDKFVNKFKSVENVFECEDKCYLLSEPNEVLQKVDCMTQPQLAKFLEDQIRKLDIENDISKIKQALETQNFDDLDTARTRRILLLLDKMKTGVQTLKDLARHEPRFQQSYSNAINQVNEDLKQMHIAPWLEKKDSLEKELGRLQKNVADTKVQQEQHLQNLEIIKSEFELIQREKVRIINDIRIQTLVRGDDSCQSSTLLTYEELSYQGGNYNFDDVSEFVKVLQESFYTNENGHNRLAHNIVYQLKDSSCFLIDKIDPILQFSQLSNNCKIIIQQVEADWLKFEKLYNNGLKQIWTSAHEQKNMFHFFVLEDLNMASIECYGRPLLDVMAGIRQRLPGLQSGWPENLWVFGVPIPKTLLDENFGLPMLKSTYKHWGYMPTVEPLTVDRKAHSNKMLLLSQVFKHHIIVPSFFQDYFPD